SVTASPAHVSVGQTGPVLLRFLIVPAGTDWHCRPAFLSCGSWGLPWVFPLGMSRGVQTAGPHTRKKPGEFPKLNSMTHGFHSVKVEGHIVNGIQDLRQQFT